MPFIRSLSGSSSEEIQQKEWLGDLVEGPVEKVTLKEGDTMFVPSDLCHEDLLILHCLMIRIIPSGYIHAVVSLHPLPREDTLD